MKKENKIEKCKHIKTYEKTTMSFVFTKCQKCGEILASRTNRDPAEYNRIMDQNK
jgi:hypothetical protein